MLLSIKKRQEYLKVLGFYTGAIDGSVGSLTKKAYKDLQAKYFVRTKDIDGVYGNDTDILLRSAYNLLGIKNFKLDEFKCGCNNKYCTGYPAVVDKNLVINAQKVRDKYKNSITVTSALRCKTYNSKVGGILNSEHTKGKAIDVYISGGQSDTHKGRTGIVDFWDTLVNSKYAYCNGYMKFVGKSPTVYKSKTMGNATHLNIK